MNRFEKICLAVAVTGIGFVAWDVSTIIRCTSWHPPLVMPEVCQELVVSLGGDE